MRTSIRKMGNSQGVLIPKLFLTQMGMGMEEVDIDIENDVIVIRKLPKNPREGWAQSSKKLVEAGDDELVWPEFANEADQDWIW